MSNARTVFSLHGIRTRGAWQKSDLSAMLSDAGLRHLPLDYGRFFALALLIPSLREKKIRWFWEQYADYASDLSQPPHVIAHSFGTYIVCEALRMHGEIKLGKIILCGSIVHPRYPWQQVFAQGRLEGLLNDYGSADVWTRTVGFVVSDAGPSGRTGFADVDGLPIAQRRLPGWRHSDFFNRLHFASWIRFLHEGAAGPVGIAAQTGVGWRAWVGRLAALLLLLVAALAIGTFLVRPVPLRDGLVAAHYGSVSSAATWRTRFFEREIGDPDSPPREGDTVVALRPIAAFSRVPRRWIASRLGSPVQLQSGERCRVRRLYSPPLLGIWITATVVPKPEGLEAYQYRYRYSYDEGCSGFLMTDGARNWAEFTPGDDNCLKTIYPFREVAADSQFLTLYSQDRRGYYFRFPVHGGRSALAGPHLLPDQSLDGLRWSPHYKVRLLEAGHRSP